MNYGRVVNRYERTIAKNVDLGDSTLFRCLDRSIIVLSAELLNSLLCDGNKASLGIVIAGVRIDGKQNVSDSDMEVPSRRLTRIFNWQITISRSRFRIRDLRPGVMPEVDGSVSFSDFGPKLETLNVSHSADTSESRALNTFRTSTTNNVQSRYFHSNGIIEIPRAIVGGQLRCCRGELEGKYRPAITIWPLDIQVPSRAFECAPESGPNSVTTPKDF